MKLQKFNTFISTINFVLFFVGYLLISTLFLPMTSDIEGISRTISIPYHLFSLLITLIVIIINIKSIFKKYPIVLKMLLLFWILLTIRIAYDLLIRTDLYIISYRDNIWAYIFLISIPAIVSLISSYDKIDLSKALHYIYFLYLAILGLSFFTNEQLWITSDIIEGRQSGNLAINFIQFGHVAVSFFLLSIFFLLKKEISFVKKMIICIFLSASIVVMLRTGSRGPLASLFIACLFWTIALNRKRVILGFLAVFTIGVLVFIFFDSILHSIGTISPVMERRLILLVNEGDLGGRENLYSEAINLFLDNPIYGAQFALFKDGIYAYSHNIVLDAFMGLGIVGGVILLYILLYSLKQSYQLISVNIYYYWVGLLLLQNIVASMFSGNFYQNPLLSVLLTFVILKTNDSTYKYNCYRGTENKIFD